jgi:hypothetical protein
MLPDSRIVVTISNATATGRFHVNTVEHLRVSGIRDVTSSDSDVTAVTNDSRWAWSPGLTPFPGFPVVSSLMPDYDIDIYASSLVHPSGLTHPPVNAHAPVVAPSTPSNAPNRPSTPMNAPTGVTPSSVTPSSSRPGLHPNKTLVLPNHVTLQIALGCLATKPTQGLYLRYFRTSNSGQMATDVMLVHNPMAPPQ